jgi:hypothetical protein
MVQRAFFRRKEIGLFAWLMQLPKSFNGLAWMLVLVLASWTILIPLFREGMFMDGVLYSAVANNLSKGIGHFWNPSFSPTLYPHFHEQPPFGLWLQSLFFIDGASRFPERMFDLSVFIATVAVMLLFWQSAQLGLGFWPVLLWISIPTVQWGIVNNVLEQPMALFDLLSIFFSWKNFQKGPSNSYVYLSLALLFLFLASFTKGIQGLFPLTAPLVFSFAYRKNTQSAILASLSLFLGIIVCYALMVTLIPSAMESYKAYFQSRFDGFPNTRHANTEYRIALLGNLLLQLAIPLAIIGLTFLFTRKRETNIPTSASDTQALALSFFLIACSASLPIMLSHEQRGFYLNTSMPFYALALAAYSYNLIQKTEEEWAGFPKLHPYLRNILLLGLFLSVVGFWALLNSPKRDKEKLSDLTRIGKSIYPDSKIGVDPITWTDWGLQNYSMRYQGIALDPDTSKSNWYLIPIESFSAPPPSFERVNLETQVFVLLKRKKESTSFSQ